MYCSPVNLDRVDFMLNMTQNLLTTTKRKTVKRKETTLIDVRCIKILSFLYVGPSSTTIIIDPHKKNEPTLTNLTNSLHMTCFVYAFRHVPSIFKEQCWTIELFHKL